MWLPRPQFAVIFSAALLLCTLAVPLRADVGIQQEHLGNAPRSRLGLSVGSPQTIAITYEYAVASPLQVQANVGTVLAYSAVSGRLLVVPDRWRLQPYAFLGGGALYSSGFEDTDGEGWTGFTWAGAGLRLRVGWLLLFGELGEIANLNESKDYDARYSAGAVGFLIQF